MKRIVQTELDTSHVEGMMFRVWHYTNPPSNNPTVLQCETIEQAVAIADAIAIHELNLGEVVVHSNAQGIDVWTGDIDGDGDGWDDIEYHLDSVLIGEVGRAYVEREY